MLLWFNQVSSKYCSEKLKCTGINKNKLGKRRSFLDKCLNMFCIIFI